MTSRGFAQRNARNRGRSRGPRERPQRDARPAPRLQYHSRRMTGGDVQRPPREPLVPPGGHELLARDMTAVFSADCTLQFAQDKLAELNQWLPVDGDPDATLGSLIESNSTGPLRLGF